MSISFRKSLLTVTDETAECNGFFTPAFIKSQEESFRKVCKAAGLEEVFIQVLEDTYLAPIMDNMRKLQNTEVLSFELIELSKEINRARDAFVKRHKEVEGFSPDILNKIAAGFDDLVKNTRNYIQITDAGVAEEVKAEVVAAKKDIVNAKLRKVGDFCCIMACAGWCPVENLLTLCHCRCFPSVNAKVTKCVPACGDEFKLSEGHWSIWAPRPSIASMQRDIAEQDKIIKREKPTVMAMM